MKSWNEKSENRVRILVEFFTLCQYLLEKYKSIPHRYGLNKKDTHWFSPNLLNIVRAVCCRNSSAKSIMSRTVTWSPKRVSIQSNKGSKNIKLKFWLPIRMKPCKSIIIRFVVYQSMWVCKWFPSTYVPRPFRTWEYMSLQNFLSVVAPSFSPFAKIPDPGSIQTYSSGSCFAVFLDFAFPNYALWRTDFQTLLPRGLKKFKLSSSDFLYNCSFCWCSIYDSLVAYSLYTWNFQYPSLALHSS